MQIVFILLSLFIQSTDQFYADLNDIRLQHNLKPLERSIKLEYQCKAWLNKMHTNGEELVHDKIKAGGEVLARNPDNLIDDWMNSPPHRAILLDSTYTKVGLSIQGVDACARVE